MTGRYGIVIDSTRHPETVAMLEQAEQAVAEELDMEDPPRWAVARELAEAYLGHEPLGAWQDTETEADDT